MQAKFLLSNSAKHIKILLTKKKLTPNYCVGRFYFKFYKQKGVEFLRLKFCYNVNYKPQLFNDFRNNA